VYKKRWPLRVSACGKRTKRTEQGKNASTSSAGSDEAEEEGASAGADRGDREKGSKKRFRDEDGGRGEKKPRGPNVSDNAMRRLKHKVCCSHLSPFFCIILLVCVWGKCIDMHALVMLQTVMTRNKVLVERGQKKAQKGRHGKRLGGVVKRAMKASKMQK
jgi:hypothetical protein